MDVPAIRDRPSLIGDEWLWDGFLALNTCRPVGFGPGPIPWTAIDAYANAEKFDEHERWVFFAVIRHMDGVWLQHVAEKEKAGGHKL